MTELIKRFSKMGIHIPNILLPGNVDMNKWAVIACDQFTSQRDYWHKTTRIVEDSPSTLRLILPECFLEDENKSDKISLIKSTMKSYLDSNLLRQLEPGFVLVNRSTPYNSSRKGLILAIDLEQYCFNGESKCFIRPTEGTVIERLPPRIEIRENAPLDVPHILLLINDKDGGIIESAFDNEEAFEILYDFELMQNGGRIRGHHISEAKYLEKICSAFEKLFKENEILFAVGDGNHSLASAKEIWQKLKKNGAPSDHPARYALVEVNNIFNEGIIFEPIHRVLLNVDIKDFFKTMKRDTKAIINYTSTEKEVKKLLKNNSTEHIIGFLNNSQWGYISINDQETKLSYEIIQKVIDGYLKTNINVKVDYIHGDNTVNNLGKMEDNLVLYFPVIDKSNFFNMISEDGSLPRKTFSIGEAEEKRYYIESRKIH